MTDEELVVEVALARLEHPGLDLDEIVALVVRRGGREQMLQLAERNLAARGELRGGMFEAAVEQLVRIVLTVRDGDD